MVGDVIKLDDFGSAGGYGKEPLGGDGGCDQELQGQGDKNNIDCDPQYCFCSKWVDYKFGDCSTCDLRDLSETIGRLEGK